PSTEDQRQLSPDGEPRLAAGDTLIIELEPVQFEGQERILTERPRIATTGVIPEQAAKESKRDEATRPGATPVRPTAQTPAPTAKEIERSKAEEERLKRLMETVRRANPFRLNRNGAVDLPGLGSVPLAGLTAVQATQRLAIEPFL